MKNNFLIPLIVILTILSFKVSAQFWDTYNDTWSVTDGLNRKIPNNSATGDPKANKTLAVFYYMWHEYHADPAGWGPFDITKLLAANPTNPAYAGSPMFHWWGQPWMGYYNNLDVFIFKKHMQMLIDAQVDYIFFDVTNANIYASALIPKLDALEALKAQGMRVPKFLFIVNSSAAATINSLWTTIYSKNLYSDLWAYWGGKPLLLADPTVATTQQQNFFTMRYTWAWNNVNGQWTWLDNYPQPVHKSSTGVIEEMSVTTAGHPISDIGKSYNYGEPALDQYKVTTVTPQGVYFNQQWSRALSASPPIVLVTQWNEWIAQRFIATCPTAKAGDWCGQMMGTQATNGSTFFVDDYNAEFNRDIEPSNGINRDNYYYQLMQNVRKYKGVRAMPQSTVAKTITINTDFSQWFDVGPEYRDNIGDIVHRDNNGYTNGVHYTVNTGRNDIVLSKVARDNDNIYFYVKTNSALTASTDANWMTLYIDADTNRSTGWEGYDYILNRTRNGNTCSIEKNNGGWSWSKIGDGTFAVKGDELQIQVSRSALGQTASPLIVDFKWVDNVYNSEIMNFIDQGDIAPNGRCNYRFIENSSQVTQTPYNGIHNIPGKIEAEDYDNGGQYIGYSDLTKNNSGGQYRTDDVDIESTTDTGGGFDIYGTQAGEWLKYTSYATETGLYNVSFRVASTTDNRSIRLFIDNRDISGSIVLPNTGGAQTWQTFTINNISIQQGNHLITLFSETGDASINSFSFVNSNTPGSGIGLTGNYFNDNYAFNTTNSTWTASSYETAAWAPPANITWFTSPASTRIDTTINVPKGDLQNFLSGVKNLNAQGPISVRWTGAIVFLYSGDYTFYLSGADGMRLKINNKNIIGTFASGDPVWLVRPYLDSGTAYLPLAGTVAVTANQVGVKIPITVEYYSVGVTAWSILADRGIKLEWESTNQVRQIVPKSQLYPDIPTYVNNLFLENNITIYPNPLRNQLTINSENLQLDEISITDLQGRMVYRNVESFKGAKTIDLKELDKGVYFISLKINSDKIVKKIIVQ